MPNVASADELIDVPDAVFHACDNFGKQCQKTTCYDFRGQSDTDKIALDHSNGKVGEWCVYSVLKRQYPGITTPDMKIYNGNQKSWESDLIDSASDLKFAVKTQEVHQSNRFGMSWIFHRTDKEVFGPEQKNLYICFVLLDRAAKSACVCAIVSCDLLHKNSLFKPLKISRLNATKRAIYYADIKNIE